MDTEHLLRIAEQAARKAGHLLLESHGEMAESTSEVGRDIKLRGDRKSEELIIEHLGRHSTLGVMAEEGGGTAPEGAEPFWVVDPLDGSLNYARGLPMTCVSIGLWGNAAPVLGAVYDFNRDEMFTALASGGAWVNGQDMRVGQKQRKDEAVLCTGFPVNTDFSAQALSAFIQDIRSYKKVRMMGTAAFSLACVAAGRADVYHERDIMLWDIAGGLALIKGAGGTFTIEPGRKENSYTVRAANHALLRAE